MRDAFPPHPSCVLIHYLRILKVAPLSSDSVRRPTQWRNDRGAEGGSCPRAQHARGRKIGGVKVGFMQFVE